MDGSEFVPLKHKALLLINQVLSIGWERPSLHGIINYPPLDSSQSQLLLQANPGCVPARPCENHVSHLSTQGTGVAHTREQASCRIETDREL